MPRKTWNTQADWNARGHGYTCRIRDPAHPQFGQRIGYSRLFAQRVNGPYDDALTEYDQRMRNLVKLFAIARTDRLLIVGCGFGFLIDAFKDAGFTNVWGVDDSTDIDTRSATETRGGTLFIRDSIKGGGLSTSLTTTTGSASFAWVIEESVIESYEDSEMDALLNAAERFLGGGRPLSSIIHIVMTVTDTSKPNRSLHPIYNQKTLKEWRAIRPDHSWLSSPGYKVAGRTVIKLSDKILVDDSIGVTK